MDLTVDELLELVPVLPVVVLEDADDAVPLARALAAGGLPAVEVTLRTCTAYASIARIADEVPEVTVGAGTIVAPGQIALARNAGAQFLVSPGATPALLDALEAHAAPFLAGVATPSEVMRLLERGINAAKLFPAEAAGGTALLRAIAGPLPTMRFCPTGGITEATAPEYLALRNVACVGGTWIAPRELIAAGDWGAIEARARAAAALSPVATA